MPGTQDPDAGAGSGSWPRPGGWGGGSRDRGDRNCSAGIPGASAVEGKG